MPGPFEIAGLPTSESLSEPPITFTLNPDGTWTDLTDYTFGPPAEITGPQYTYEDGAVILYTAAGNTLLPYPLLLKQGTDGTQVLVEDIPTTEAYGQVCRETAG